MGNKGEEMKRAAIKSSAIISKQKKDLLTQALGEVLQALGSLIVRIENQISLVTHSETVDETNLFRELAQYLKEYRIIADAMLKLASPIEHKVNSYFIKTGFQKQGPIPASSLQPVMLLHLLREQAMGRRQQEMLDIEKRKRDSVVQVEAGWSMALEQLLAVSEKLNFLCYMTDFLKKEHAIPANIMYHTNIPETVSFPFERKSLNVFADDTGEQTSGGMRHKGRKITEEEMAAKKRELLAKLRGVALKAEESENMIPVQIEDRELTTNEQNDDAAE